MDTGRAKLRYEALIRAAITRAGGITALARDIGTPSPTVVGWLYRGAVAQWRWARELARISGWTEPEVMDALLNATMAREQDRVVRRFGMGATGTDGVGLSVRAERQGIRRRVDRKVPHPARRATAGARQSVATSAA